MINAYTISLWIVSIIFNTYSSYLGFQFLEALVKFRAMKTGSKWYGVPTFIERMALRYLSARSEVERSPYTHSIPTIYKSKKPTVWQVIRF